MKNRMKTNKGVFERRITRLSKISDENEPVVSENMILGEVKWFIECERDDNRLIFSLRCTPKIDEDIEGAVMAEFYIRILSQKRGVEDIVRDSAHLYRHMPFFTCDDHCVQLYDCDIDDVNTGNDYIVDDKIEFEVSIEIANVAFMGCFEIDFLNPTKNSDAVLVVEDKKLHVNKKFLATHSSYFAKMFKDGGTNDEFKMASDAKFVDICEILRFIYSDSGLLIDRWNMMSMLKLADDYDVPEIMNVFAEYAISIDHRFKNRSFQIFKIADKHRLTDLHSYLLKYFSIRQIKSILKNDGFETLSTESKNALTKIIETWQTPGESSNRDQCRLDNEIIIATQKSKNNNTFLRQGTFVTSLLSEKKSEQFYIGDIPWLVEEQEKSDEESENNDYEVNLTCNTGNVSPFWSVEANVTIRVICQSKEEDEEDLEETKTFCFNSKHGTCRIQYSLADGFAERGKNLKLEISMKIEKVDGFKSYTIDFSKPTKFSDVVLVVEGKKIHVCKEYLAMHSSVFEVMFFSEFREKNQEEIELKGIEYETFVDMLTLIYPCAGLPIHAENVESLLQIADYYDIQKVRNLCLNFLMKTKEMSDCKKLEIIDKYRLDKNKFMMSCTKEDIERMKGSEDFENLSVDSLRKLIDRLLKI